MNNKIKGMDSLNLSRKKLDEIKRKKEEIKKDEYYKYVEELDELYFDLYSDEYMRFYNYFRDLLDKKFYCVEESYLCYNDFVKFVDGYSRHKEDFKDNKINEYLDDETSEEEFDDDILDNDFFLRKGERF